MLTGAHAIVYSADADADRAFCRDVLGLPHVDVGHGWLIFALPPSELAVHSASANGPHELYLICDDVRGFVEDLRRRGVACTDVSDQRWGLVTTLTLPGGGALGVYEPRHARPDAAASDTASRSTAGAPPSTAENRRKGRA